MPFAQWHYPFENEDVFERRFPADFVSEAIDQTRGWFYTLLAISTLVRGQSSYKNCVCLGHIVDAQGRKMSKSLGNSIDPWTILDSQGADALRWYMLTAGTPWSQRRMSADIVQESLRKYLLTLWNTYSFWVTYASLEGFDPARHDVPLADRSEMDRWILAELEDTVRVVTAGLDDFDTTSGRRIDRFVDDLSNWYVRRSRRRFWRSGEDADTRAAFRTLWECLVTVAQLSAPFTPHVSDAIYRNLTGPLGDTPDSVHLTDWPTTDDTRVDDDLRRSMAVVRSVVGLGRAVRTNTKVKVRQPLSNAFIVAPPEDRDVITEFAELIKEELNVKAVSPMDSLGSLVTYVVKPNFKALGPRFGPQVKEIAQALARVDTNELMARLDTEGRYQLALGTDTVDLERTDLDIRMESETSHPFAEEGRYAVALDTTINSALRAEGIAREVIRGIQDLRKAKGLAVEDRIHLRLASDDETIHEALQRYKGEVAGEVLATTLTFGDHEGSAEELVLDEGRVSLSIAKV
jgi:isoleucyl-tRNA synthetase